MVNQHRIKKIKFLIVKTYQYDKYDRYLTDVFTLPDETNEEKVAQEGKFLNQEILDAGKAVVWSATKEVRDLV